MADPTIHHISVKSWVPDMASPALLRMLRKNTSQRVGADVPPIQFAPQNGPKFFARQGWNPVEVNSILKTAAAVKRFRFPMRLLALLPESASSSASRPWSGVCLLAS
jgi:hypothetical protein